VDKLINVIIPLSGHSRRFRKEGYLKPKALLPVGKKPMIEHVVDMFDNKICSFHFVINNEQADQNPDLEEYLVKLVPNATVTIIKPHDLGPVFSLKHLNKLDSNAPIIISYCDFVVEWNFRRFINSVTNFDGAIPAFKGFHPASFGDTFFAYMSTDFENNLLELREKNSFTKERCKEPASAGIYYFREKRVFDYYADELLSNMPEEFNEAYVSLLYNFMIRDNLKVLVTDVSKFICLGTPSDYEQYKFWFEYFTLGYEPVENTNSDIVSMAIIPMAGKGSRFVEYGYKISKPLISVEKKPMILHALNSIPYQNQYLTLVKSDDKGKYDLEKLFSNFTNSFKIVEVESETSGQAATCLLACEFIPKNTQIFITSCDYRTLYNRNKWDQVVGDSSIDGAIWVTRAGSTPVKDPKAFAYCKTDKNGRIYEIIEKDVISDEPHNDPLVIGTFWYRNVTDFVLAANHVIRNDITVNGEHYVATSINHLLSLGRNFVIYEVDKWVSFGDPFELTVFEYWEDYFINNQLI
jgi:NDP-sugar pyrophosphorylase family protein